MLPITRLFESEAAAHAAIDRLVEGEEPRGRSIVINPTDLDAKAQVDAAVAAGSIMEKHRDSLLAAVDRGRFIVSSRPQFLNTGSFVQTTLDATCVDPDAIVDYTPANPSPFSDLLGMPVLWNTSSKTELWEFNKDSSFGISLLSHDNPTPLSSLFRIPLLKTPKSARGSSVERMSGTSAPFSSKIGMKLLSEPKTARGSSVERWSSRSAPFSGFLGLRVLSKDD
ncbi:MAG: hypothetical protein AAGL69_17545 [Pseudomonadota bacterium]